MKYADDYLNLIKTNPVKIAYELGYTDLTELHNEWIKKFIFAKEDYLLQSHRGSYKTTCLKVALPIIMTFIPNDNILMMRKADPDVVEIVKGVEVALRHPLFIDIAYNLWGKELKIRATQNQIDTNLVSFDRGTSQLLGLGVNSSLTGKHFERIYTDDIVNIKDRISEAERKHTKLVYQELQNLRNRGGLIGNTGTPWHKEDAFELMPAPKIYDCYSTGLISKEQLQKIRKSMTPSLFAANYELKHIADENALFTNPQFTSNIENIYNGICHVDAGYGGEDYTAFTIMRQTPEGFVAYGKMWQKHVDKCLEEIFLLREKYRAGSFAVENNGDKGYLSKELYKIAEEYNKNGLIASPHITVNNYHERMNKDVKIKTYLYTNWNKIKWLDDTDSGYLGQILDYTEEASHDDAPDSAASLLRRMVDNGTIKAISSLWD